LRGDTALHGASWQSTNSAKLWRTRQSAEPRATNPREQQDWRELRESGNIQQQSANWQSAELGRNRELGRNLRRELRELGRKLKLSLKLKHLGVNLAIR
jgi:hypothetical protein